MWPLQGLILANIIFHRQQIGPSDGLRVEWTNMLIGWQNVMHRKYIQFHTQINKQKEKINITGGFQWPVASYLASYQWSLTNDWDSKFPFWLYNREGSILLNNRAYYNLWVWDHTRAAWLSVPVSYDIRSVVFLACRLHRSNLIRTKKPSLWEWICCTVQCPRTDQKIHHNRRY